MLIAFEGQDGAGKTAILAAVHEELARLGIASAVVDEFSDSPYGQRLVDAVARDKFLRPAKGGTATYLTRALDIVTDLYYLDERVIGPALAQGKVVLKDRHRDTILYTLIPTLVSSGAVRNVERALTWLSVVMSELRRPPDLTVCVSAPLSVRLERIRQRTRHLMEDRANEISDYDRAVFNDRDQIMFRLIKEDPSRFLLINNSHVSISEGVCRVVEVVQKRLTAREVVS